jgi:hypothetical protein
VTCSSVNFAFNCSNNFSGKYCSVGNRKLSGPPGDSDYLVTTVLILRAAELFLL